MDEEEGEIAESPPDKIHQQRNYLQQPNIADNREYQQYPNRPGHQRGGKLSISVY